MNLKRHLAMKYLCALNTTYLTFFSPSKKQLETWVPINIKWLHVIRQIKTAVKQKTSFLFFYEFLGCLNNIHLDFLEIQQQQN